MPLKKMIYIVVIGCWQAEVDSLSGKLANRYFLMFRLGFYKGDLL